MDVNIVSRAAGGTGAGAPARRPKTPPVAGSGEASGAAARSGVMRTLNDDYSQE